MASTNKNNGLIKVIRVNKKPELIGQSVINNVDLCVISLGLNDCGNQAGQKLPQTTKDIR